MSVSIWHVLLSDGDWYKVFATSRDEAVEIVQSIHYDDISLDEFIRDFAPTVDLVPDGQRLVVNDEFHGTRKWTAKRWAKNEKPGPFTSNTYDY